MYLNVSHKNVCVKSLNKLMNKQIDIVIKKFYNEQTAYNFIMKIFLNSKTLYWYAVYQALTTGAQ